jgi:hypothetical protein
MTALFETGFLEEHKKFYIFNCILCHFASFYKDFSNRLQNK